MLNPLKHQLGTHDSYLKLHLFNIFLNPFMVFVFVDLFISWLHFSGHDLRITFVFHIETKKNCPELELKP